MTGNIKKLLIEKLGEKTVIPKHVEEKMLQMTNSLTLTPFFSDKLPTLDEIELDMIFSYIFTPDMETKALFGANTEITISENDIYRLAEEIESEKTIKILVDNEGNEHLFPLKEVNICRYIKLLHLTKNIPAKLIASIEENAPLAQNLLVALIRDTKVPLNEERVSMIDTLLHGLAQNKMINDDTCTYIIEFIEQNQVKNLNDFEYKLIRLYEIYKADSGKKIYYSDELEGTYGDNNIMEVSQDKLKEAKDKHRELTAQIKDILGYIHDETPAAFR